MYKKVALYTALILIISSVTIFGMNTDVSFSTLNNNVTQKESENKEIIKKPIPSNYVKVAENEILELYLNESTLGIKIINKKTGYVWSSGLDKEEENLNQTWQGFADSGVTIEYINRKGKIEKASLSNRKNKIKIRKHKTGFSANVYMKNEGFEFDINVSLEKDGIIVKIPKDSLKEEKEGYNIEAIFVYPFLGATKDQDIPGYMFIPDGSGALMRIDKKNEIATEPFIKRIYGDDLGMIGVKTKKSFNVVKAENAQYPVFGVVHNVKQNGYVGIIDEGAAFCEINAYPSGLTTEYNWISPKFILRENYFQPINKKGDGVVANQKTKNEFDISIKYLLLSGEAADYVGMAKKYQSYLVEKGLLVKKDRKEQNSIPVRLEFIGAENKKRLIGKSIVPMTTVKQMNNILDELDFKGVKDMTVVFRGWTKGGITGTSPKHFPFENKVGSNSEWKETIKKYEEKNIPVFLYTDYVKAYKNAGGYSKIKDVVQSVSEQILSFNNRGEYFNLSSLKSMELLKNEEKKFDKSEVSCIAMDTIGSNLFSNYNEYNHSTRNEVIDNYKKMFEGFDKNLGLYKPNDYLWKYTDKYFDIPMSSSNFVSSTDSVPFLQITLKGYIDYYAEPSNFNASAEESVLRMIDYGVYPSFYITKENSVKLIDTESKWLYTSQYDIWEEEIIKEYTKINEALKPVKNATITKREILEDGVVKVSYDNKVEVFINYTNKIFNKDAIQVEARNFKVIGGN